MPGDNLFRQSFDNLNMFARYVCRFGWIVCQVE